MKVLVIGSGGREHALLWKLAHSPSVKEVYVIPGNDGMTDVAHLIPVKGTEDILDFARLMEVDLTVAGPETVLTEGLADKFAEKGMAFFGPSAAAAQIEGSKSFAKNLMKSIRSLQLLMKHLPMKKRPFLISKNERNIPLSSRQTDWRRGRALSLPKPKSRLFRRFAGCWREKPLAARENPW